jgi:hypothetical protein
MGTNLKDPMTCADWRDDGLCVKGGAKTCHWGGAALGESDRLAELGDHANTEPYVLTAQPGAGMTTAFRTEANRQKDL